jgi:hypothetical protein
MTAAPSPLKAIRMHCLWCCCEQPNEVKHCGAVNCNSYPLRFRKSVPGIRPLTVIKNHCAECSGDEQAKDCKVTDCALWHFRTGRNPNRAGLGNHSPNQAGLKKKSRTQDAIQTQAAPCAGASPCPTPCAVCACSDRGRE